MNRFVDPVPVWLCGTAALFHGSTEAFRRSGTGRGRATAVGHLAESSPMNRFVDPVPVWLSGTAAPFHRSTERFGEAAPGAGALRLSGIWLRTLA